MSELSLDVVKRALPSKYKNTLNDEVVKTINEVLNNPELGEIYRENFLSYSAVLEEGKFKLGDYLNAVKYCTHKLMGCNNTEAFMKTFPDKYQDMLMKGYQAKDITSLVSVYNKGKLVNLIMEQSLIPSWVLNQDLYQKAINVQAELMLSASSEKVRSDAANSLLIHLKPPEVKKVELDIGVKDTSMIEQLKMATLELVNQQQRMIKAGVVSAQEVAETKLIGVIEHED